MHTFFCIYKKKSPDRIHLYYKALCLFYLCISVSLSVAVSGERVQIKNWLDFHFWYWLTDFVFEISSIEIVVLTFKCELKKDADYFSKESAVRYNIFYVGLFIAVSSQESKKFCQSSSNIMHLSVKVASLITAKLCLNKSKSLSLFVAKIKIEI